jgi:uncharacterized lipoprotein YddW (UPF0748 family)
MAHKQLACGLVVSLLLPALPVVFAQTVPEGEGLFKTIGLPATSQPANALPNSPPLITEQTTNPLLPRITVPSAAVLGGNTPRVGNGQKLFPPTVAQPVGQPYGQQYGQEGRQTTLLGNPYANPANKVLVQTPANNAVVLPAPNAATGSGFGAGFGNGTPVPQPAVVPAAVSLTPDQQRHLDQTNASTATHQRWVNDALVVEAAMAGTPASLPTDALLDTLHKVKTQSAWQQFYASTMQYDAALTHARQARQQMQQAAQLATPSYRIEGRALWLDRGSIINCQTPEALRQLMRNLKQLGINTVFFETINAGYALYQSQYLPMNPLMAPGWDPLAVAVDEGHKQGIEVHAWVWCFAVGNVRHNHIVNQPAEYAGPVLVEKGLMGEALRGNTGNLIPRKGVQHEYWLSPASPKGQAFLLDTYKEIVSKYPVDGLQLDYIRYPFQNAGNQMGFESPGRARFEEETGLYLNGMDDYTLKSFIAWKTYQVTRFVQQVATTLKGLNPQLCLSAAVYAMPRTERIVMIQQDWETWLDKGWIDVLTPMTYTPSPKEYESTLNGFNTATQRPAIIYPGIALHRLEGTEVTRLQQITQASGWQGNTMFAHAHLSVTTREVLAQSTYQVKPATPPHRNPAANARAMLTDLLTLTTALHQLGDRQFDEWVPLLQQTDTLLAGWQSLKLPTQAEQLRALLPQLKAMAVQCRRNASSTVTPYRTEWMGTQCMRLHHLIGVVARQTDATGT